MTKLLYLEDFNLLDVDAKVVEVLEENGRIVVVLDQTVFYPQGGGQPYDQGIIESLNAKFLVEEVRFLEGVVKHIGKFEHGVFQKGETVQCKVDGVRRALNSQLHSAGHVVEMAVVKLGLTWIPGKGYHFPDGPYVEYTGSLEGIDKEKLKIDFERACNEFVSEGRKTELRFMPKSEMSSVCHFVPDYIPEGKPACVVLFGDFGVPCGGTHVSNLSEIKQMTIRKIKAEGKNIRVGYDVVR
jgi:Ser-tRNA(Ala) deacylase AlaX